MSRSGVIANACVFVVAVATGTSSCGGGAGKPEGTGGVTGSGGGQPGTGGQGAAGAAGTAVVGGGGTGGASAGAAGTSSTGAGGDSGSSGGIAGSAAGAGGDSGAMGAAGVGGDSGATGAAGAAGAPPQCRTYATAYTFDATSGTHFSETCSHAETTSGFDRICASGQTTYTEHWLSKSDFIDEAAAVGISKIVSMTEANPTYLVTYEYDAQGRLQKIISGGSLYSTYDAWDTLNRPLHFVLAGGCASAEATYTYGDSTMVWDVQSGPCKDHIVTTYDADRIATNVNYASGVTGTYTITGRATVCP